MEYNKHVESFRDEEYPMLKGKTYLDHGGSTLYARSLVESFSQEMLANLYGNPHSASEPAELSGRMVDDVREEALRFFGADPKHFDLVFVANATAAIKLVMDCFRDLSTNCLSSGNFKYFYHKDSHTSLVGIREATTTHHCFKSDQEVEEWIDGSRPPHGSATGATPELCLFAYPGQSNMTGRRLPLSWPGRIQRSNLPSHQNTYTLLDAAALATTSSLENVFSNPETAPDFTALSFYKIFGFPDLGALIVRRKSDHILSWRKYFGGGTIDMITVLDQALHFSREGDVHNRLEDGTLGFHNILALGCAIAVHGRLYSDQKRVARHVSYLGHRLFTGLISLRHSNGKSLCEIYNEPGNGYNDSKTQGGTVAFNIKRVDGSYIDFTEVETKANDQHIYVRAGGLCNPGGIASYLSLSLWQMKRAWAVGTRCSDAVNHKIVAGKPIGVVRASLGAMSTIADVDILLDWLSATYIDKSILATVRTSSIAISSESRRSIRYEVNHTVPASQPLALRHGYGQNELNHLLIGSGHSKDSSSTSPQLPAVQQSFARKRKPLSATPFSLNETVPYAVHPQNLHSRLESDSTHKKSSASDSTTLVSTNSGHEYEDLQRLWLSERKEKVVWATGDDTNLHRMGMVQTNEVEDWEGRMTELANETSCGRQETAKPAGFQDVESLDTAVESKERRGLRMLWKGRKGAMESDE